MDSNIEIGDVGCFNIHGEAFYTGPQGTAKANLIRDSGLTSLTGAIRQVTKSAQFYLYFTASIPVTHAIMVVPTIIGILLMAHAN